MSRTNLALLLLTLMTGTGIAEAVPPARPGLSLRNRVNGNLNREFSTDLIPRIQYGYVTKISLDEILKLRINSSDAALSEDDLATVRGIHKKLADALKRNPRIKAPDVLTPSEIRTLEKTLDAVMGKLRAFLLQNHGGYFEKVKAQPDSATRLERLERRLRGLMQAAVFSSGAAAAYTAEPVPGMEQPPCFIFYGRMSAKQVFANIADIDSSIVEKLPGNDGDYERFVLGHEGVHCGHNVNAKGKTLANLAAMETEADRTALKDPHNLTVRDAVINANVIYILQNSRVIGRGTADDELATHFTMALLGHITPGKILNGSAVETAFQEVIRLGALLSAEYNGTALGPQARAWEKTLNRKDLTPLQRGLLATGLEAVKAHMPGASAQWLGTAPKVDSTKKFGR